MADYKCKACGASFPSQEALNSHATLKVGEESSHFAKMSSGQGARIQWPGQQEKPS
jgi:hypothetical protein